MMKRKLAKIGGDDDNDDEMIVMGVDGVVVIITFSTYLVGIGANRNGECTSKTKVSQFKSSIPINE